MPRGRGPAPDEAETKARILDAASQCFRQLGIAKTSLSDVARIAGLSRGTLYRHFGDRDGLVQAVVEVGTDRFFEQAAVAMGKRSTLAKQLAAYAEFAVREALDHRSYSRVTEGDTELIRLLVADSEASFRRSISFLEPYIEAAKERGEVGGSVAVTDAAEWVARVLMTLSSSPVSARFDVNDPKSVGRFVERYAVAGLAPKP